MSDETKPRKWSEEEQEEVRQRVAALRQSEDLTWKQISNESGLKNGTLTPWMGRTYAADGSNVAEKLQRYLEAREKAQAVRGSMPAPRFVSTPTSEAIMRVLAHAQHMPDMVVITGAPGTGKSSAACEYTRTGTLNVYKMVADPSINSVRALLGALANLLGTYDQHSQYRISRSILQKLQGTGALIIIDEAQHLTSAMLDQLRAYHDQANIGIALLGNEAVIGRLEGGRKSSEYAQLYSRVGMRLKRTKPLKGDVDALLDAWGVEAGTAREQLRATARLAGGLRNLNKTWRLAQMIATNEGRALSAGDVQMAWQQLSSQPLGDAA